MGSKGANAPKGTDGDRVWINDLEIENAVIKWPWSHFNGAADTFNDAGDRNFTVVLNPDYARQLMLIPNGWAIKEHAPREEGDEPEYTLKIKISYRFEAPRIFFLKEREVFNEETQQNEMALRKFRVENEEELSDITRGTVERIDFVAKPSRWVRSGETGVTAYLSEMYVHISESKMRSQYDDVEEV